jgi:hypothetical protein
LDALEEKLSTTLVLKPKRSNNGSPPKIPARRTSVDSNESSPSKLLKVPELHVEEKITKPVEKTPMKTQEVDAKKAAEEVRAPIKMNNITIDRKPMAPKLKIDPGVDVKQPASLLKVPTVPAVARGPMKFNTSDEVKKPEELKIEKQAAPVIKKPEELKIEKQTAPVITKPEELKIEKQTAPVIKKQEAKKPEETKKPEEVKKLEPVIKMTPAEAKKPERMMVKDLKEVEWSDGKNIKAKIVAGLEHNVFTMCEASEKIEAYYSYIAQEINSYCVGKPTDGYQPM